MGQKWVKNAFFQKYSGPFGMLKQVVWTHFEPVVPRFGPRKIPKCLTKGLVHHQKWVKTG